MKFGALKFVVLGLLLIGCGRHALRSTVNKPEIKCVMSQISGAYNSGFSRATRTVLLLMPDSTFQLLKASDVGAGEETRGRYLISGCAVVLEPEPFNGQNNYLIMLDKTFFAYQLRQDYYLARPQDTTTFLKAAMTESNELKRLIDGVVYVKAAE